MNSPPCGTLLPIRTCGVSLKDTPFFMREIASSGLCRGVVDSYALSCFHEDVELGDFPAIRHLKRADEIRALYCPDNGRPGIDPVVLPVGYLYGIEPERRIEQELQINVACRWFLGLDLDDRIPDHSTISQNRRRRFHGKNLFRRLFEHILHLCMEKGRWMEESF